TSYNRNVSGRHDANPGTHSFVASPEIVIALALSGKLTFNPLKDTIINEEGLPLKLQPPTGSEFPNHRYERCESGDIKPAADGSQIEIIIDPDSQRLQLLQPFPVWNGQDYSNLHILAKISGKCTTDHISPAGKWFRYRGHLDHISDNLLTGALNAFRQ